MNLYWPSDNRCMSDFAIASSNFLASLGISNNPITLAEIPHVALGINMEV